jgi:hypothetical protein
MTETFLIIGGVRHVGEALTGFACVVSRCSARSPSCWRAARARRGVEAARHDIHAGELEERMAEIARIRPTRRAACTRWARCCPAAGGACARGLRAARSVTYRIGQSMQTSTQNTMENLQKLTSASP